MNPPDIPASFGPSGALRSGAWLLDPEYGLIDTEGGVTRLPVRLSEVLFLLARRPGRLVTREELLARVWQGRVVTEESITVAIHQLRRALGDSARSARYIETVPKRGYRWVAPVTPVATATARNERSRRRAGLRRRAGRPTRHPGRWAGGALVAVLIVTVMAGALHWMSRSAGRARPDCGGMPCARWVALRQADLLLAQRTDASLAAATQMLTSLAAQSTDAAASSRLAQAYALRADIGMVGHAAVRDEARRAAREAIRLAPTDAESWAAQGAVLLLIDLDVDGARRALSRALDLDRGSSLAHHRSGWVEAAAGRSEAAIRHFRRAIELDPTRLPAYADLAFVLFGADRIDEGLGAAESLRLLAPERLAGWELVALGHELDGQLGAAARAYRRGLELRSVSADLLARYDRALSKGALPAALRIAWAVLSERATEITHFDRAVAAAAFGDHDAARAALAASCAASEPDAMWAAVHPRLAWMRREPGSALPTACGIERLGRPDRASSEPGIFRPPSTNPRIPTS